MRSQIVITIDTEVNRRNKYETVQQFAVRMDEALTHRINQQQAKPAYQNWDLLSVTASPLGQGFFTTLWEYDPELHEDVKTEGDTESENKVSNPSFFSGIMDEFFGQREGQSIAYIGDDRVHDVKFGEIICINGVNFKLTHFGQDYEEAMATLTPLKEVTQQEEPPARTYGVRDPRPNGVFSRYGQSFEVRDGVRRRTPYQGPRYGRPYGG